MLLYAISQTLQHNSLVRWCQEERSIKRNFFSVPWSIFFRFFKFNVVGYRLRFDFNRVPERECEIEMVYRLFFFVFVCLSLHVFGWNLNIFCFLHFFTALIRGRKGDLLKTVFCSVSFSRIIAYEHSNDETFIEL